MPTIQIKYAHVENDAFSSMYIHVPMPYSTRQAVNAIRVFVAQGHKGRTWAVCDLPGGVSYVCHNINGFAVGKLSR